MLNVFEVEMEVGTRFNEIEKVVTAYVNFDNKIFAIKQLDEICFTLSIVAISNEMYPTCHKETRWTKDQTITVLYDSRI